MKNGTKNLSKLFFGIILSVSLAACGSAGNKSSDASDTGSGDIVDTDNDVIGNNADTSDGGDASETVDTTDSDDTDEITDTDGEDVADSDDSSSDSDPTSLPDNTDDNPNTNNTDTALVSLIDDSLIPNQTTLSPFSDGVPRPVATTSYNGASNADFVSNELLLTTDDETQLNDFLERWNGKVVLEISPSGGETSYLVRIDTELADTQLFGELLKGISPEANGTLSVSNEQGIELITAAAIAQKAGLKIDINWVMKPSDFNDRKSIEGNSKNAFDYSYMKSGGAQNMGVTDAWLALERAGKINNKVTVAILDGGFAPNDDFPSNHQHIGATLHTENLAECGGNPCPWHGTGAANAISGLADNLYGGAGSAGPIANLITYQFDYDIASLLFAINYIKGNADIVSISAGMSVPGWLADWTFDSLSDDLIRAYNNGVMIFASAGNNNTNVDAGEGYDDDPSVVIPCELATVTCIGALKDNSNAKISYSNYFGRSFVDGISRGTVDFFAPTNILVGADPQTNSLHFFGGTSAAAPFAAGIAALVKAANPSLSSGEVSTILVDTVNTGSSDSKVDRWLNAKAAVLAALNEDNPPFLKISPEEEPPFEVDIFEGTQAALRANIDDLDTDVIDYNVHWSYINHNGTEVGIGVTKTGENMSLGSLCDGTYDIKAKAIHSNGSSASDNKQVTILQGNGSENCAWTVNIAEPSTGNTYIANEPFSVRAIIDDDHDETDSPLSPVTWHDNYQGQELANGLTGTISLPEGTHRIVVKYGNALDFIVIDVVNAVGTRPTANITPSEADLSFLWSDYYNAGDDSITIPFTGSSQDAEDGTLTGNSLKWSYRKKDTATWTNFGTGTSTELDIPLSMLSEVFARTVTFEVRLIATDSEDLTGEKLIEISVMGPAT